MWTASHPDSTDSRPSVNFKSVTGHCSRVKTHEREPFSVADRLESRDYRDEIRQQQQLRHCRALTTWPMTPARVLWGTLSTRPQGSCWTGHGEKGGVLDLGD